MLDDDALIDLFADRGVEGARPWPPPKEASDAFEAGVYYLGAGNPALEVCVVPSGRRPKRDEVRDLWRARQGRRASPLLLICPFAVDGTVEAQVCGPAESDLAVRELGIDQAIGLAAGALEEPNGLAAVRYLQAHTPRDGDDFVGLLNQGVFAAHTLRGRVREMPEWAAAAERCREMRAKEGRDLVRALGFTIEDTNTPINVLRAANDQARAVAVFLDRDESYESEGGRFGDSSALSQAFTRAARDNIPFVVLTRGSEIRLYAASSQAGVGRKGQAETYVQANVSLLADDEAGFLPLIFSAEALADGGTFEQILDWSRNYSADLSSRLRDRVYVDVVPALAIAVAQQHTAHGDERSLDDIYEETLIILFRLLFLAYAEDRGLLPYATNATYRRNSLKQLARDLATHANEGKSYETAETHNLWTDIGQLFEAIDKGYEAWSVPAYNGGLFSPDPSVSAAGGAIDQLRLSDAELAPALTSLLNERDEEGELAPIDFRSLSVRDFGTLYEGLLESSLSVATSDLSLDARGNYVPATETREVVVPEGQIYFHNRSGARKSTGSYFTKDFAVEHLLDRALEPALDEHLDRLTALIAAGDDDVAGAVFFDFRCADLAMGSGHFLVAAVDHIEKRLAEFLDEHPIPSCRG